MPGHHDVRAADVNETRLGAERRHSSIQYRYHSDSDTGACTCDRGCAEACRTASSDPRSVTCASLSQCAARSGKSGGIGAAAGACSGSRTSARTGRNTNLTDRSRRA